MKGGHVMTFYIRRITKSAYFATSSIPITAASIPLVILIGPMGHLVPPGGVGPGGGGGAVSPVRHGSAYDVHWIHLRIQDNLSSFPKVAAVPCQYSWISFNAAEN